MSSYIENSSLLTRFLSIRFKIKEYDIILTFFIIIIQIIQNIINFLEYKEVI